MSVMSVKDGGGHAVREKRKSRKRGESLREREEREERRREERRREEGGRWGHQG